MRHQHLLIRRLGTLLRSRMTRSGHLAQTIYHEHRGNCLPPRNGCTPACTEAAELVALTEPFMQDRQPAPPRPLRLVVLKRPARRVRREPPLQPSMFEAAG